jgi:hypothetical protein
MKSETPVQTLRLPSDYAVWLAADLQAEFPGMAGFSPLNVWRMRAFYEAYAGDGQILSQAVTELASATEVAQPV